MKEILCIKLLETKINKSLMADKSNKFFDFKYQLLTCTVMQVFNAFTNYIFLLYCKNYQI